MMHETIVVMNVTDETAYGRYRAAIAPVLARFGGRFAHDFRVETLRTEAPHPVTRVFALRLPTAADVDRFFADPDYRAAKAAHHDGAVDGFTVLATHDVED